jgi:protein subunit release factor A
MPKEPDDIVLRNLREIRATLDDHSKQLQALPRIEKQLTDLSKVLRYSMGQNAETEFRQSQQESRIDELFEQLEKLLNPKEPA